MVPRCWGPVVIEVHSNTYFHYPKLFSRDLQFNSRKGAQFNHGRQNTDRDSPTPSVSYPPGANESAVPHPSPTFAATS